MFRYFKEIKSQKDRLFLTLMIFALCEQTIFVFPLLMATRLLGMESLYGSITTLIYVFLAVLSISKKRIAFISPHTFVVTTFFLLAILFTFIFHPENSNYLMLGWKQELKPIIPWLFLGTCFYADKISMETIGKWCSFGVVFLSAYLLLFNNQIGEMSGEYDMAASYRLLLNTIITINYAFNTKDKLAVIASAVGVFYSFAMGTRGPVLVILAFILLVVLKKMFVRGNSKLGIISLVTIGVAAILFIGITPILTLVQDFLANAGFSTRVLDKALDEEVFLSNGRMMIYDTLLTKLREEPWPHGLYAEKQFGFFSAHNLYIETLFYYGLILGSIVIIYLIILPIRAYSKSNNAFAKQWILMFSCLIFVHGLFGGKLFSPEVFFMIGFCIKELSLRNHYNRL